MGSNQPTITATLRPGLRVTVKKDVFKDRGVAADGSPVLHPQKRCEGKTATIVQVGTDGPVTCPDPKMVLIDDQYNSGKKDSGGNLAPEGQCTLREWIDPALLEIG